MNYRVTKLLLFYCTCVSECTCLQPLSLMSLHPLSLKQYLSILSSRNIAFSIEQRVHVQHQCSAQGHVFHCQLRHQGWRSAQRQVFHRKLRLPLWSRGNIVTSQAAGPGSIPGRVSFLVEVFPGFSLRHVGKFGPHSSPFIQPRRAKTDLGDCCQMAVLGALRLAKRISLNLFRYFSYQVTTKLSSRGWVDPVPDPILPEQFLDIAGNRTRDLLDDRRVNHYTKQAVGYHMTIILYHPSTDDDGL